MTEKLLITSSPHLRGPKTVRGIMLDVVIALVPASAASVVFFGLDRVGGVSRISVSEGYQE